MKWGIRHRRTLQVYGKVRRPKGGVAIIGHTP